MASIKGSFSIKRAINDLRIFYRDAGPGCYLYYDDANLTILKALVVGPKDTPYFGGFYCFNLTLGDSYPMAPPTAKYLTTDGYIRLGPNIYQTGNVCLSILNTWGDKDWTPVQNLLNIVTVLQSILNDNPLNNEPNYYKSKITDPKCHDYIGYVHYHNYAYAIAHILQHPPVPELHQIMINHFLEDYPEHVNILQKLIASNYNNTTINTIYSHSSKLDFTSALNKINEIKKMIDDGRLKADPLNCDYADLKASIALRPIPSK
jgi:ubiquitin-protein ligase